MMPADEANLWSAYLVDRSTENRNRLVTHHISLVKRLARKFLMSNRFANYDDLLSHGYEALIWSVERFDQAQRTKFTTFATRRIRGALLDCCREADRISRTVRHRIRDWDNAADVLRCTFGRNPSADEVEHRLGIGHGDWKSQVNGGRAVGNPLTEVEEVTDRRFGFLEFEQSHREPDPCKVLIDADQFESVLRSVFMNPLHKSILRMRFQQGLGPSEIGELLGRSSGSITNTIPFLLKRIAAAFYGEQAAA